MGRGSIPSFIHVSDGKLHDVHALDLLTPEAGAIYVKRQNVVTMTTNYSNFCFWLFKFLSPFW